MSERVVHLQFGERTRLLLVFALLALVPLFLSGWLGYVQVLQAAELQRWSLRIGDDGERVREPRAPLPLSAAAAARQSDRRELLPAARGTISDRNGAILAIDVASYEVRADLTVPPRARKTAEDLRAWVGRITHGLADAVTAEAGAARQELYLRTLQHVHRQLAAAVKLEQAPGSGRLPDGLVPRSANLQVDGDVDNYAAATALRRLDDAEDSVLLHFLQRQKRAYPDRDFTWHCVGWEDMVRVEAEGVRAHYQRVGHTYLEASQLIEAGADGRREFRIDARPRAYWLDGDQPADAPRSLRTTLDLELQKRAALLLASQVSLQAVDGRVRPADWGAMALIEIASGDVLALASWNNNLAHPKQNAATPFQKLYEPGSIVKPLVFAWALQFGGLDWNAEFDCSSSGHDHAAEVAETGRRVRDDHAVGVLTPHGILVNSSNIGAVKVGALLDKAQWQAWFDFYGLHDQPTGLFDREAVARHHRNSFAPKPERQFRRWTLSSFCQGYELSVNALAMARAYLSMLSGGRRELRLVDSVEIDGTLMPAPAAARGPRLLKPAVIEAVTAAMVDVISEQQGATGRFVVPQFRAEEGIELHGLVAGKTGTAVSHTTRKVDGRNQKVEVRNASFVGFAPADAPRYLVVCVLQKEGSAKFYGGSYAAPLAIRLLLQAMQLETRRAASQDSQVSATPGEQAGANAPGSSQAGR